MIAILKRERLLGKERRAACMGRNIQKQKLMPHLIRIGQAFIAAVFQGRHSQHMRRIAMR